LSLFQLLLGKLLRVITILVGVTLIVFLLMHAIPGNPWSNYSSSARMMPNIDINKHLQQELYRHFGLNLPLWRQFTRYIIGDLDQDGSFFCGALCGNLGPSIRQRGRTVVEVLFEPPEGRTFWQSRFGYSFRLVLFGALIATSLGITLGIWSATRPRSRVSRVISVGLAALISIPNFVLGLLAIIILASWLRVIKVLPDWNHPEDWIVPAVVLAVMPMANLARVTRASVMNILGDDYVRTARGKGLTQTRVMLVHVMRNALVPILTFLGPTVVEMFAGLLIVENLYSFPGFGREFWISVLALDYPTILGLTWIYAAGIVLVNTVTEALCEILDPRVRLVKGQGAA